MIPPPRLSKWRLASGATVASPGLGKREALGRYQGSAHGLLWSFFNLPFMLTVYSLVFSEVFQARWSAGSKSKTEFALVMFMISIFFYLTSALPERYRHILYLNPLTPVIEMNRDVLYWGKLPDFAVLALYWLTTGAIAGLGWHEKIGKGFADVL